jgi:hypothetical protein
VEKEIINPIMVQIKIDVPVARKSNVRLCIHNRCRSLGQSAREGKQYSQDDAH